MNGYLKQAVQWRTCAERYQCASIVAPLDYANPSEQAITLALARKPATATPKLGTLFINPGGPGESGVNAAVSLLETFPEQVRERFDVVGFDPRGVGSSTPTLWCNSDADNDADRADPQVDYSPAGVEHIETTEKQYVQRCIDKMGKDFLANVGTANVVKDLDMLRAALGDPKLTYLGYSYGTRIGAAYAEAFPDKVAEADAVLGAYAPMRLKLLEKAAAQVDARLRGLADVVEFVGAPDTVGVGVLQIGLGDPGVHVATGEHQHLAACRLGLPTQAFDQGLLCCHAIFTREFR